MELKLPEKHIPGIKVFRPPSKNGAGSYIEPEYVLHVFTGGTCLFRLEDRVWRLGDGHTLLIPPYLPHALLPHRGPAVRIGVVHFIYPAEAVATLPAPMVTRLDPRSRSRLLGLFEGMARTRDGKSPASFLEGAGLLLEMLALHLKQDPHQPEPAAKRNPSWRQVEAAMGHMHRQPERAWSLGDVADAVDLSPNFLCRVFKQYTGQTPHGFLNLMRVERAKALLATSSLTAGEIAERVGYANLPHFSRVFKKVTGKGPREWRENG